MDQPLFLSPGKKIQLRDFDPSYKSEVKKKIGKNETRQILKELDHLAYRLYAESHRSVLVVLQGMDASGKDGTIRMLARGISPQCLDVVSFKEPSSLELSHDFLWRVYKAMPAHGRIGIFNRSHYEDVLVVRIRKLCEESVWQARYEQINSFEKLLTKGGLTILKCFLHISKDEQRQRFEARLQDPQKQWKLVPGDIEDRERWDAFQDAYNDALTRCNTTVAPWHIVPADRKWYRDLVVARLLRDTLKKMNPRYPEFDPSSIPQMK